MMSKVYITYLQYKLDILYSYFTEIYNKITEFSVSNFFTKLPNSIWNVLWYGNVGKGLWEDQTVAISMKIDYKDYKRIRKMIKVL